MVTAAAAAISSGSIVTVLHPQSALLQVVNKLECGRSFEGGLSAAFGVGCGHVLLHCGPQHPGESLINLYTLHNCMSIVCRTEDH